MAAGRSREPSREHSYLRLPKGVPARGAGPALETVMSSTGAEARSAAPANEPASAAQDTRSLSAAHFTQQA